MKTFTNWFLIPFAATAANYGASLYAVRYVDATAAILIGSYVATMMVAAIRRN